MSEPGVSLNLHGSTVIGGCFFVFHGTCSSSQGNWVCFCMKCEMGLAGFFFALDGLSFVIWGIKAPETWRGSRSNSILDASAVSCKGRPFSAAIDVALEMLYSFFT